MTAKNVSASVRQRLLNLAQKAGTDYNQLLIRHGIERVLYRLSVSPHAGSFVLKGAMLFALWKGSPHRPTQDLDLLGFGDPSPDRIAIVFKDICNQPVDDDGWRFDPATVTVETIRTTDEYGGTRVHFTGRLGTATIPIQVDIGFGDAITPAAKIATYPVLLDQPSPELRTYPPATVVAEKTEAIVKLGMLNTRMKDYYDLAYLAENFTFEGQELVDALKATFDRRSTAVPSALPTGLSNAFAIDAVKQKQWVAFTRRIPEVPASLVDVVSRVAEFLQEPLTAAYKKIPFPSSWTSKGPWRTPIPPS